MSTPLSVRPGDVVRRTGRAYSWIPTGYTATVRAADPNGHDFDARQLHILDAEGDTYSGFSAADWEIVEPSAEAAPDERRQLRDLRKAACALYLEGKWILDEETDAADLSAQAKLWADLRDALGFKPGFNTTVSVTA